MAFLLGLQGNSILPHLHAVCDHCKKCYFLFSHSIPRYIWLFYIGLYPSANHILKYFDVLCSTIVLHLFFLCFKSFILTIFLLTLYPWWHFLSYLHGVNQWNGSFLSFLVLISPIKIPFPFESPSSLQMFSSGQLEIFWQVLKSREISFLIAVIFFLSMAF